MNAHSFDFFGLGDAWLPMDDGNEHFSYPRLRKRRPSCLLSKIEVIDNRGRGILPRCCIVVAYRRRFAGAVVDGYVLRVLLWRGSRRIAVEGEIVRMRYLRVLRMDNSFIFPTR
jgi:hypothetical protein